MTTDRRPLHRPLSAPPADVPVQAGGRARLLAVERATLQEPAAPAEAAPPAVPSSGRRAQLLHRRRRHRHRRRFRELRPAAPSTSSS
ncbi:hypothetical protein [Kitasatospora sp. NPDC057223]|uniref:hypothetical protein n=1 Tax=Kitasatospora sp. NPDC057223 TaxID=3346055 RepID=UPI0036317CE0